MASARARVYGEVTVPFSEEIYVRQQNEYRDERGEWRWRWRMRWTVPVSDDDFEDLIETSGRH